jgi:hypothetical protein
LALSLDTRWLNFGSHQPWDAFIYFVIAPVVGALMLRRHERARFSVYVFLSCEILRAIRIHSGLLGLLAVNRDAPNRISGQSDDCPVSANDLDSLDSGRKS